MDGGQGHALFLLQGVGVVQSPVFGLQGGAGRLQKAGQVLGQGFIGQAGAGIGADEEAGQRRVRRRGQLSGPAELMQAAIGQAAEAADAGVRVVQLLFHVAPGIAYIFQAAVGRGGAGLGVFVFVPGGGQVLVLALGQLQDFLAVVFGKAAALAAVVSPGG